MRSIPLALALIAGLSFSPAALGQETKPPAPASQEGLPEGADLFARHVQAIGGDAALRAERNRVAKFKQEVKSPRGTMNGVVTVSRIAPSKLYLIVDFPGAFTVETWCDGENAWQNHSHTGAKRFTGDQLAAIKRDADFLGEADYKNRYREMKTLERTTFAERPAYAVKVVPSSGAESTAYFDAEKGFLIGFRTLDGGKERTTTFSDYKQFGATFHAGKSTMAGDGVEVTTTLLSLETDLATPPNVDPPEHIRKAADSGK